MSKPPKLPKARKKTGWIRCLQEDEDMSVMELYERNRTRLPFLMIVTLGNYGETDLETFGGDQVFRLAAVSSQKRVIARDIKGRYLTIPVNFSLQFREVLGRKTVGPVKPLAEIIENNDLPCIVQFAKTSKAEFKIGADKAKTFDFGNIAITEIYEEKYFLGNSLDSSGNLLDRVILIPLFLKEVLVAKVNGVEDMQKHTKENLEEFMNDLNKAAEEFTYDLESGNPDIALLPEDCELLTSENVYDYIDSKYFVNIKRKTSEAKSPTSPTGPHNYESLSPATPQGPKLPPRQNSTESVSSSRSKPKSSVGSGSSSGPTSPISPISPNTPGKQKNPRDSETDEAFFSGGSIFQGDFRGHPDSYSVNEMSISGGSIGSGPFVNDYVHDFCIDDISDALKKLKLDKYVEPLSDAQIDGQFLLSLDEDTLKEDFGMKKFEAVKLMLFARTGHVPK